MATVHPYQPKHITPTDEQVAVQMSAERTLIIEANAGAAKTTTLALRMAQAWTTGMPPERCLALTYTDTACQALQAALRNDLPGPWDTTRLPLTALDASASYDGTRWTVPSATLQAGTGSITAQGHYTPATHALEGQATLRALRPDALHTLLAAAPGESLAIGEAPAL